MHIRPTFKLFELLLSLTTALLPSSGQSFDWQYRLYLAYEIHRDNVPERADLNSCRLHQLMIGDNSPERCVEFERRYIDSQIAIASPKLRLELRENDQPQMCQMSKIALLNP